MAVIVVGFFHCLITIFFFSSVVVSPLYITPQICFCLHTSRGDMEICFLFKHQLALLYVSTILQIFSFPIHSIKTPCINKDLVDFSLFMQIFFITVLFFKSG